MRLLARIARGQVSILVRGDTGTGKDVTASAIHAISGREGRFVAVNCGSIPSTLIENELFGSRRGAFSGAADRLGMIRSADRGTLFLDEIAELNPASQAALLRVLQDGEVPPLGSDRRFQVDVRVVAATNRDIPRLIDDGLFRRDLYARLRRYEITLPALRDRIEDMGLLVAALMLRWAPNARERKRQLSRAAARALFLYHWPLHIRELEQTLRATMEISTNEEIRLEDLPGGVRSARPGRAPSVAKAPRAAAIGQREVVVTLLHQHGGNLSAVAREIGTSRT